MELTKQHIAYWRQMASNDLFKDILSYLHEEYACSHDGESEYPHIQQERYGRRKGFDTLYRQIQLPPQLTENPVITDAGVPYDDSGFEAFKRAL